MRATILGLVLTCSLGGTAYAQTERQAVPTDECTPGSMQVILGLCTESQREQARKLNTDRNPPRLSKPEAVPLAGVRPTPGRSRAAHGGATVSVHFSADEIAAIDAWIARQPDHEAINRAEAVHRLSTTALPPPAPAQ